MNKHTPGDVETRVELTSHDFKEAWKLSFLLLLRDWGVLFTSWGPENFPLLPPRQRVFLSPLQGYRVLLGPWLEHLVPPLNH